MNSDKPCKSALPENTCMLLVLYYISRYVNGYGLGYMMIEPPQYQTSENHRKSRSSFKKNMRRSDGKSVLQPGSAKMNCPLAMCTFLDNF